MSREPADPKPRDEPDGGVLRLGGGAMVRSDAIAFKFVRSSGPGGQNVNKVSTAAELRVAITAIEGLDERAIERLRDLAGRRINAAGELVLRAETSRSQRENREICLEKLKQLVSAAAKRPKIRRPTKPTRGSKQRRLEEKTQRGEIKRRRSRPEW
jgi:ribosome-associated protein